MTFARPDYQSIRAEQKAENMRVNCIPSRAVSTASMSGATSGRAVGKTKPKRCPSLLEMARGRGCLLCIHGVCNGDRETTVAAHSNLGIHGKSKGRKADDCYSVFACAACHQWLDQGPAPKDVKALAFTLAHIDQVVWWRRIATDPQEPERFRKAARWALDQLNATPIGESNV